MGLFNKPFRVKSNSQMKGSYQFRGVNYPWNTPSLNRRFPLSSFNIFDQKKNMQPCVICSIGQGKSIAAARKCFPVSIWYCRNFLDHTFIKNVITIGIFDELVNFCGRKFWLTQHSVRYFLIKTFLFLFLCLCGCSIGQGKTIANWSIYVGSN